MSDYEELRLELGALHVSDVSSILTRKLTDTISRPIYESGARRFCHIDKQLVNARGISIYLPRQAKMIAKKIGDLSEVDIGNKKIAGDLAETYIIAARGEWGYAAAAAKDFDLISNEIDNCRKSIQELELEILIDLLSANAGNPFNTATSGTLAYADLVKARELNRVDGWGTHFFGMNPVEMSDVLKDATLIDSALYVSLEGLKGLDDENPVISILKTKHNWELCEANKFTADTVYGWSKDFATFVEKVNIQSYVYDAGKAGDPRLAKGVVAWEMLDIVKRQANAAAKMTVTP